MNYEMTSKERRRLKKIASRVVMQSECHTENITEYYRIMDEAARAEFTEDNDVTLCDFLLECFQKASEQVLKHALIEYTVSVNLEVADEQT